MSFFARVNNDAIKWVASRAKRARPAWVAGGGCVSKYGLCFLVGVQWAVGEGQELDDGVREGKEQREESCRSSKSLYI